ncbi:hypothetical protein P692DRAFT_20744494, partial [Suillus brevipes Sb2]
SNAYFDAPCNSNACSTPVFNVSTSFRSPSSDSPPSQTPSRIPWKISASPPPRNSAGPFISATNR